MVRVKFCPLRCGVGLDTSTSSYVIGGAGMSDEEQQRAMLALKMTLFQPSRD